MAEHLNELSQFKRTYSAAQKHTDPFFVGLFVPLFDRDIDDRRGMT